MPLSGLHEKKINKNFKDNIVKELKTDGALLDHLMSEEVLGSEDYQHIYAKITDEDKTRELLFRLIKGPKHGYEKFLAALREDGVYETLADKIENTHIEPEHEQTLEKWVGEDRLSSEKEGRVLKDLDLLHFSKALNPHSLGKVGTFFELSAGEVQSIEYKHARAPESACHELLVKWRNKNGNKATVRSLLEILFKAWQILPEAIYDEKVRDSLDRV